MGLFLRDKHKNEFRREENPALFDAVKAQIESSIIEKQNKFDNRKWAKMRSGEVLTDEYLQLCEFLDLHNAENGVTSLKGIEHLTNLRSLYCSGYSEIDALRKLSESYPNLTEEEHRVRLAELYKSRQIEDISPLYFCKKLRSLFCDDQDSIIDIDLGQFPELYKCSMQRCSNLTTISGMWHLNCFDKVFYDSKLTNFCQFDFSGSTKLKDIQDIVSIMCKMYEYPNKVNFAEPIFCFPIESYIRLSNNPQTRERLREYVGFCAQNVNTDVINWTENSEFMSRCGMNTRQAYMMKERLDAITNSVCSKNDSKLQSLYNVYQWITTNVLYDYTNVMQEDYLRESPNWREVFLSSNDDFEFNTFSAHTQYQMDLGARRMDGDTLNQAEVVQEIGSNARLMRSAYVALFNQKSVCGGISNLFNAFAVNLGINARPCFCNLSEKGEPDRLKYINHQISAIDLLVEDKAYTYFFDITADLGGVEMGNFALSSNEAQNRVALGAKNANTPSGKDLLKVVSSLYNKSWFLKLPKQQQNEILNKYIDENNEEWQQSKDVEKSGNFISRHGEMQVYPNQYDEAKYQLSGTDRGENGKSIAHDVVRGDDMANNIYQNSHTQNNEVKPQSHTENEMGR